MSDATSSPGRIDYPRRYQLALVGMIRELLVEVAEEGLPGDHFFYLTFDTSVDGVRLSPALRERYPEAMTIVLQHQFRHLEVDADGFGVELRFDGRAEALWIPWSSLLAFVDPAAEFGLQLRDDGDVAEGSAAEAGGAAEGIAEPEPAGDVGGGTVVRMDDFKSRD